MNPRETGHQIGTEIRETTPLLGVNQDSADYRSALGFSAYRGGVRASELGYGDLETKEGAEFLGGFLSALYGRD